jgi:hypothetical protein
MVSSSKCSQADMTGMTQYGIVAGYAGVAAGTGTGAESVGRGLKRVVVGM